MFTLLDEPRVQQLAPFDDFQRTKIQFYRIKQRFEDFIKNWRAKIARTRKFKYFKSDFWSSCVN
jgi:hypothetical protein